MTLFRRTRGLLLALLGAATCCVSGAGAVDYGASVRWTGQVDLGAPVTSAASDGVLAVSIAGSVCHVSNVSVPAYPTLMGTVPLASASTRVIAVADGYAYLEDDDALIVLDVRQEVQPAPVGSVNLPSPGGKPGALIGSTLYLARGAAGLEIIDLGSKSHPILLGAIFAGELVTDVAASGDTLALLSNGQLFRLLDAHVPGAPTLLGSITLPPMPGDLDISGALLAVSNTQNDRVQLFDLSNPSAITLRGSLALPIAADHIDLEGHRLIASRKQVDEGYEVLVIDASDPTAPRVLGGSGTPEEPNDVRFRADRALVAGGSAGLGLITLGNSASPPVVGSFSGAFQTARGLDVAGDRVYFLEGALGRVHILDVSNPATPIRLGGLTTASANADLAVNGSLLAITIDAAGVEFWDVSNPAAPAFRSRFDTQRARKVAWSGTRLYVADDFGLYILDLVNPAAPVLRGSLGTSGGAADVAVLGNAVYLAAREAGVRVIDATSVSAPALVTTIDTPGSALGLDLRGSRLAVADGSGGLRLYDLATPLAPTLEGVAPLPGTAREVSLDASVAYVADDASMIAVDLRNAASPYYAGCGLPWDTIDLAASGGYVYAANASFGLRIVPGHAAPVTAIEARTTLSLSLVVAPNPSRGPFWVALRGSDGRRSAERAIAWQLFDVGGRCVWSAATLSREEAHRLSPRRADGAALTEGTYFLRVVTSGATQTTSIELLR